MSNPFYKFLLMGALLTFAAGCSDDNTESNAPSFAITAPTSENYQVTVAESAKAGDEVSLAVIPSEGMEIVSVHYNEEPCTFVSSDAETNTYNYSFTMPACDVTLDIEVREMAPTEYSIYYDNADQFSFINVPQSAVSGTEITFYINVTDLTLGVTSVSYGTELGEVCEQVGDVALKSDYKQYTFKFTMPAHDVALEAMTSTEFNDITLEGDDHARINMLNALVKDENGDPILDEDGNKMYAGYYNQPVQFTYDVDLGYNYTVTIVGKRTGSHYEDKITFEDNGWDYNSYWVLIMPAEPLTMTIKSTEKTDFAGKALVGSYKGFFINTTQLGKLERYDATTLDAEIKSNTAFTVKSTDANNFDFQGMVSYDESTKHFACVTESCETYGLSGNYDDKMTLAWVSNLIEDMPENIRFYVMSKNSISNFVSAGNAGGSKYLVEVKTTDGMAYYLFEREYFRMSEVEMEFTNGKSLGDASAEGFVLKLGEKVLKYTYDGSTTNLIEKGKEAGTYTPANGSGDNLVLDGFGNGQIGSKEGTYTISDGIVTLTCNGEETKYNIDMNAKTYSPIAGEGEWNGPTTFYVESNTMGYYKKATYGNVKITLTPSTKKAWIWAQYKNTDNYNKEDAVNSTVSYVYDATNSTLTLSQVLMGDETGAAWYKRVDIVLKVSADKQKLTFTGIDKLYSGANPKYYVVVTDLEVPAQQ